MKFSSIFSVALAGFAAAAPTPTSDEELTKALGKRASVTDACDIGYASLNGGTTGGKGGATTTVSSVAQFTQAAESKEKLVIYVKGHIKGSTKVRVGSNKSIIGAKGSKIEGLGLYINKQKNVILRNLAMSNVLAKAGDAIGIQASTNVWVDHCDLSSDRSHGKDYYDGLLDVTHGADWVTVSNTFIHDHYKALLIGHTDKNGAEDKGKLHVTYANNYWFNINSRAPSVRFGTVHVYNNYFNNIGTTGVNTRMGAQVRVESTAFENSKRAITSANSKVKGAATVVDVSLGGSDNSAPKGSFTKVPYKFTPYGSGSVKAKVVGTAGQTLAI